LLTGCKREKKKRKWTSTPYITGGGRIRPEITIFTAAYWRTRENPFLGRKEAVRGEKTFCRGFWKGQVVEGAASHSMKGEVWTKSTKPRVLGENEEGN